MFSDLSIAASVFLGVAILLALGFEFVNGFHDTANAVATVIYTHSLKPNAAVVWSGLWNLIGVLVSSGAVAFGIVALLPIDLIMNVGSGAGFAMVFSLLISAMLWNLGTWYVGLPASSSHTLIGSILGVGLANAMLKGGGFREGVNWAKAREVAVSLLASPVIGFLAAGVLLLLLKSLVRIPELYAEPDKGKAPPLWIRAILIATCTGVSFAHGSNDGQKGMGLIVLILVGILPGAFALNPAMSPSDIQSIHSASQVAEATFSAHAADDPVPSGQDTLELSSFLKPQGGAPDPAAFAAAAHMSAEIRQLLEGKSQGSDLTKEERGKLRSDAYLVSESIAKMEDAHSFSSTERGPILEFKSNLDHQIKYIPTWVKFAVALALGLGTMIGWKRIVVTVGEKIGKTHLSYAQGAAAELVTAITIGGLDTVGLPVSTTHVLSSGVAGSMAANHSGIQVKTLRNLLLAWVLTLPVCVFLGALLFALGLNIVVGLGMR
jgi:PiT family inorganic phosphate transporter